MIIGWDSKTDTFFISDMTEPEAGALQGAIYTVIKGVTSGGLFLGVSKLESPAEYFKFLYNVQDGLLKGHKMKQKLRGK